MLQATAVSASTCTMYKYTGAYVHIKYIFVDVYLCSYFHYILFWLNNALVNETSVPSSPKHKDFCSKHLDVGI